MVKVLPAFCYYFVLSIVLFCTVCYTEHQMHNIHIYIYIYIYIYCAFFGLDYKLLPAYCMRAIKYPTFQFNLLLALDKIHDPAQCLYAMTPTN